MEIAPFFFRVYKIDKSSNPIAYLGMAIPIAPGGYLLTARHVIDVNSSEDERIAIVDHDGRHLYPVETTLFSEDPTLDLACIRSSALQDRNAYLPILPLQHVIMGLDVHTFGHFLPAGDKIRTRHGYFKGHVVNGSEAMPNGHAALTLSYPILEGLSGSAILTYHNGPKIVGLAIGNAISHIVAHEHTEYANPEKGIREKELIKRVVELGQAHHVSAIVNFAREHSLPIKMTANRTEIDGLTASGRDA